ncbi:MAG: bifunctional DNA primase/polymerase [Planctomycetaceae bacterium]
MEKKNEQTGVIHVEMSPFQGFKTLYAQGYSLVPLSPGSKKPMVKWKEYQERQPAPDKMREIMDGIRDCNWALLTGEQPSSSLDTATGIGVVILDADDLDAIELVESRCPATPLQVTTPSSGRHFYYRHPGTQVKCRQKTCIDGRKYNLDLKADGGYCVAPGGRRADGKGYVPNLPPTPELIESLPVYDPNWIVCESAPQRHDDRSHSKFEIGDDAYHEEAIEFVPVEMDERIAQAKAWMSRQPGATQGQGSGADCCALLWP